jgi:hypothetical protein
MKKNLLIIIFLFTISLPAQEKEIDLTGNISQDLLILSHNTELSKMGETTSSIVQKRKPALAAGLSALLPGAGQFYNQDYWKTAIFASIEIAAVVTAIVYNKKGDDQTESFMAFADSPQGWSVDKYAHWSVDNAIRINPEIEAGDEVLNIFDNNGNVVWSKLNRLETKIGHWYSHQLAPYGDQQYYEMIGKYQQFNPGWADFNYNDPYTYGDPLTPTFLWYADERGKANSYYDLSNLAIKVLLANHIISAVEAALSANNYNRHLKANVEMKSQTMGYNIIFYPELNLSYRF